MFEQIQAEETINLTKFKPRPYQLGFIKSFEAEKLKRFMVIWPRRCLSGNSHILMSNGSYKMLKDIKPGDSIASWNGTSIEDDIVKNVWNAGIKDTELISSPGLIPLMTTKDHKFATTSSSSNSVRWQRLDEIGKNRQLMIYSGMPLGKNNNPDLAEFIGYMTCDGYVSQYQQPKFTNNNKEILDRVAELAKKLFNCNAVWRPKGNGYDLGLSNGTLGGGSFKNKIKELFRSEKLDVPKSKKRLLSMVWDFDEESLGRFFSAVISSDGSMYSHKKGFTSKISGKDIPAVNEITISCGSSFELCWDLYWLLRKLGVLPNKPVLEKGTNYRLRISKSFDIAKLLSYGPVYGKIDRQMDMLSRAKKHIKKLKVFKGCYCKFLRKTNGYKLETYDLETEKNHNFFANGYLVHNSGKDVCAFNLLIRSALRKVALYYYILPTYSQARRIIFDNILNDGTKFIDFIDRRLIKTINHTEMKIVLINGSILQCVGSDSYDRLVGTNAYGMVFSEFSLQDPMCYSILRPILSANGGWACFIFTPRGSNHAKTLYEIALDNPDTWFTSKLTLDDTKHIDLKEIENERDTEELSEDLIQQEYYTSFSMGQSGSVFGKYVDKMYLESRIGDIPYDTGLQVNTVWDIGVNDSTAIIFYSIHNNRVLILNAYENKNLGLEHYIDVLEDFKKKFSYRYNRHFAPHDCRVKEWGSGMTRFEIAQRLGLDFDITKNISMQDGIEALRVAFSKFYIDEKKCKGLIKALQRYRYEWDEKKQDYTSIPVHDKYSHFCDATRYLAINLPRSGRDHSAEDIEKLYQESQFPSNTNRYY